MFLGHLALAFGAKRAAPGVSLGTLVLASELVDYLWPIFLLLGIEHARIDPGNTAVTPLDFYHYPWTHSLVMGLAWGLGFAGIWYLRKRDSRVALLLGALVVSHWVLDALSHRPDMPLYPGGSRVGLDLWRSVAATLVVEGIMFAAGVTLYLKATRAVDRVGRFATYGLIAFLVIVYLANVFSPPPPSIQAVGWAGQAAWLLLLWAIWADRHRRAAPATPQPGAP